MEVTARSVRNGDLTVWVTRVIEVTSPRVEAISDTYTAKLRAMREDADDLIRSREARDGRHAHVTLCSPDELNAIRLEVGRGSIPEGIEGRLASIPMADDWRVLGIGHAERGGHEAYFVVLDWPGGREARRALGLDPHGKDFHITLGFDGADVHGVPKGRSSLVPTTSVEAAMYDYDRRKIAQVGLEPGTLVEDPWKYFNKIPGTFLVPLRDVETIRARPTGIEHAEHYMQVAYEGHGKRRDPIDVSQLPDGNWRVEDGNSTTAIARKHGWKYLPAVEVPPGQPRKPAKH